ncbi:MAG: phosphoribosylformylglycinamidine synthase subunit PurQ [Planctomycetota bacterium]
MSEAAPATRRPATEPPKTTAVVIRAAGTNCDAELVRALQLAGAATSVAHLDAITADPSPLEGAGIIAFPGGFSFGDDIASGRIFAMRVRQRLASHIRAAADRGTCIVGICNGFQILVQAGLLPGDTTQTVSLTTNAENRFIDRWVRVGVNTESACVWTKGLETGATPDTAMLPVANGEGRFTASNTTLRRLEADNLVAIRYAEDVNGSANRIAGITDTTGRILGLMPHPERYFDWNRHPFWTRLPAEAKAATPPGLRLFKNAVEAAAEAGLAHTASP